jgi:general secretion pathway protein B
MSYILDALRRSQAERERGQVPGLNAQPVATDASLPLPRRPAALVLGASLVLGIALLWALLWWWADAPAPGPETAPVASATAPRPAGTAAPAPAPRPASPPLAALAPVPAPLPIVVSAPAPAVVPAAPSPMGATTAAASPPAAADKPGVAELRTLRLADLTADQRRELPALAVGGAIWSENAASRFVLFNGQVVREGEAAAPGVLLERIAPKSVLLRWRELRIEVPL